MDAGLTALNVAIGEAESRGDKAFFEELLAPAFAMRRARGSIDDRDAFLGGVKESAQRTTDVESVTLFAENRALVVCTVTMDGERFGNVRLFTREAADRPWQLLAWANEPVQHAAGA
jgi:hypothetical protein